MLQNKLHTEKLQALQNEKGNICISLIVPTHRLSPERRSDKTQVEDAINKVRQELDYKYPKQETAYLAEELEKLLKKIDFVHNTDGLGLYVSKNVSLFEQFSFPIKKKILVSDNFEIRDLLYKEHYAFPYFVLLLTEKGTRLFKGIWLDLKEINDESFPCKYEETYMYSLPSHSNSYSGHAHIKNFEKDKSETTQIRITDFFRHTDKMLRKYLNEYDPLIVLGTEKELAWFQKVSSHKKQIINKMGGSYNYCSPKQIAEIVRPILLAFLEKEQTKVIKEFEEKIGAHLAITGIQEIWDAVKEGKAFKLLVEKDYHIPGFVGLSNEHLYLFPPKIPHSILTDVIDDIIETVLQKKGQVVFTDNELLKDFQKIALITRY